ncbi:flagellar assembly protein FliH [Rubrivivax sp. JA1026]|uniref:flagellar assembly protein FliH n=1 Tax=Rubrivivax sp. JA1026 TaxID=2710888 RepID=UPI0013E91282|nr:flagellar assembly protein FliH [Rubrivivax sp. JA1026]
MSRTRPYRFPPLAGLTAGTALPAVAGADAQAAAARGYAEGQQRGWREGYDAGAAQGREDGWATGLAQAREHAEAELLRRLQIKLAETARPLEAALAALQGAQAEAQAAMRRELVDLVGRVARQVVRCELALQPQQILKLVDETLATMPPPHDGVEVRLNPEDLRRIEDVDAEAARRWQLLADPRLAPGECRVRSAQREADAGCRQRLDAVMEQVGAQLLESAAEAGPAAEAQADVEAGA